MVNTVNMAAFRDRYPHATLPEFFDTIVTVSTPSAFTERETRVWAAAIFWAMDDRTVVLTDTWDHEEAERLVVEFGPPA